MRRVTVRSWSQHPVHLFLTVVTCGLWAPVYLLAVAKGKKIWTPA
jgi:hypothetical protein